MRGRRQLTRSRGRLNQALKWMLIYRAANRVVCGRRRRIVSSSQAAAELLYIYTHMYRVYIYVRAILGRDF